MSLEWDHISIENKRFTDPSTDVGEDQPTSRKCDLSVYINLDKDKR